MTHNYNCKALRGRHKCLYCRKEYMMKWAYDNHIKVCPYKDEKE